MLLLNMRLEASQGLQEMGMSTMLVKSLYLISIFSYVSSGTESCSRSQRNILHSMWIPAPKTTLGSLAPCSMLAYYHTNLLGSVLTISGKQFSVLEIPRSITQKLSSVLTAVTKEAVSRAQTLHINVVIGKQSRPS